MLVLVVFRDIFDKLSSLIGFLNLIRFSVFQLIGWFLDLGRFDIIQFIILKQFGSSNITSLVFNLLLLSLVNDLFQIFRPFFITNLFGPLRIHNFESLHNLYVLISDLRNEKCYSSLRISVDEPRDGKTELEVRLPESLEEIGNLMSSKVHRFVSKYLNNSGMQVILIDVVSYPVLAIRLLHLKDDITSN